MIERRDVSTAAQVAETNKCRQPCQKCGYAEISTLAKPGKMTHNEQSDEEVTRWRLMKMVALGVGGVALITLGDMHSNQLVIALGALFILYGLIRHTK